MHNLISPLITLPNRLLIYIRFTKDTHCNTLFFFGISMDQLFLATLWIKLSVDDAMHDPAINNSTTRLLGSTKLICHLPLLPVFRSDVASSME
jgi:hypothetical protein